MLPPFSSAEASYEKGMAYWETPKDDAMVRAARTVVEEAGERRED